ncbi:hypothetical protein [Pelagicoccus sp. SDUM812002]|nr:hypothetical protein [Pelagicoccus sp. SDUM812002]
MKSNTNSYCYGNLFPDLLVSRVGTLEGHALRWKSVKQSPSSHPR